MPANPPDSAIAKATPCSGLNDSPSTPTPTSAALTGNSTANTPARGALTWVRPLIHSHTVTTLAASA